MSLNNQAVAHDGVYKTSRKPQHFVLSAETSRGNVSQKATICVTIHNSLLPEATRPTS